MTDVQRWLNGLPAQCQCCAQGKDARRLVSGKARCCAVGNCCKAVPSARTIKDVRAVLRSALSNAMREEFVARNVAELVTAPEQRKRKVVPWSSDEARRFLESARSDRDVMYAAYVLILVLGLRKGEVPGLRWQAVDLEGARVGHRSPGAAGPAGAALSGDQDRHIGCHPADAGDCRDGVGDPP